MIHVGIDPGITGCLATLNTETGEVEFFDTPVVTVKSGKHFKNQMDPHACAAILEAQDRSTGILVTIEKVNAMPSIAGPDGASRSMGATSAFGFGMGYGMWIGICAALLLPYQLVHPATWKASLMRDMGKEKDASRVKAMQLYPYTAKDLTRKKDHARGDALLLAHYGLCLGAAQPRAFTGQPRPEPKPPATLFSELEKSRATKTKTVIDKYAGLGEF